MTSLLEKLNMLFGCLIRVVDGHKCIRVFTVIPDPTLFSCRERSRHRFWGPYEQLCAASAHSWQLKDSLAGVRQPSVSTRVVWTPESIREWVASVVMYLISSFESLGDRPQF